MCYEPKDTESMHGRAGGVARRGGSLKVMSKSLGLDVDYLHLQGVFAW